MQDQHQVLPPRNRAVGEGVAIVAGKRVALRLRQGRSYVARLDGEGKRATGLSHGPLGFLRKRGLHPIGIAIAPETAAADAVHKSAGGLDLRSLPL